MLLPTDSAGTAARSSSVNKKIVVGRLFRVDEVLISLDAAAGAPEYREWQRARVVQVAVAHAAAVEQHGVIQHRRAVGFGKGIELREKATNHLAVISLNLDQLCVIYVPVAVMGNRMECVRDPKIGVGSDGLLRCDSQCRHAREVCLISQGQQVEHDVDLLVDLGRNAHRRIGHGDTGEILGDHVLNLPLDVAHRSQIVVHPTAVRRAESLLKPLCLRLNAVENATGAFQNGRALAQRIPGPEQAIEQLARVVLHRQHLVRRSKRVPADVQIGLRRKL